MPYFYNHKLKSPGTPVQSDFGAVFPFGYGLCYTSFEVSCVVRNTGARTGDEVVQLYTRDLYASLVRPVKELKGFTRVTLESGEFDLMIGRSSEDIVSRAVVKVTGQMRALGEAWAMRSTAVSSPTS